MGEQEAENPELVYHLYQQGCARLAAGNPQSAAEVLELAVEREPGRKASLHETLGRAYHTALSRVQARLGR